MLLADDLLWHKCEVRECLLSRRLWRQNGRQTPLIWYPICERFTLADDRRHRPGSRSAQPKIRHDWSTDESRSSLSRCIDDLGKRAARKARLCHDVVFFRHPERGMAQEILDSSDV